MTPEIAEVLKEYYRLVQMDVIPGQVECVALHDEESLSFEGTSMPCPVCGAAV